MGDESPGLPPDIPLSPSPALFTQDPPAPTRGVKRPSSDSRITSHSAKKNISDLDIPSASIENVYSHPSTESTRSYSENDVGPFIVHISRSENDPAAGLSLRPIKIGQILMKNNIQNIVRGGIKVVGRNRVAIEFASASAANCFTSHPCLSSSYLVASVPSYNVTRIGLVRGIPCDWSMSEFAEAVELPENCGKILKLRRLNRKSSSDDGTQWIPTQSVVVTFEGQILPKYIYCFYNSLPVETYQLPTIQCLNCCRFGHIKAQCRSKPRCYKCCQSHSGVSCNIQSDKISCILCSGLHQAVDKQCPEHLRQKMIKALMSGKNLSYADAASHFPSVRRPYSEVTLSPNSQPLTASSSPHHNSILLNNTSPTTSYKKTTFLSPRPRHSASPGYDRQAHQAISNNPPPSLPNGCAIQENPPSLGSSGLANLSQENFIDLFIAILDNFIMKFSDCLPNNVAEKLTRLASIANSHGSTNPNSAMEL